jgi:hypothetical protein
MNTTTVAQFPSRAKAEQATNALRDAGITFSIDEIDHEFLLRVPADAAYAAIQFLGLDEVQSRPISNVSAACPECGSFETRLLPPYALISIIASLIVSVVLWRLGYDWVAVCFLVLTGPAVIWLTHFSGKHRCSRCGWRFSP